ncbi:MAG TPA: hypothetical protein VKT81_07740 [Bryobacteraceae bacterium]|nr:hypothetical protein [Bryobacteraceae bacterium]
MKRTLLTVLFAAVIAASARADSLSLIPNSGTVSGQPGTVAGWGFNFTNSDPSNWVVLNDSFVTGSLSTGTFGNYVDYIAPSPGLIVINPNSDSGDVAFSQGTPGSGTGEFDILAFVPPMTITGGISVDYSVFSQDPNSPAFDPGSFIATGTVSATAAVDVASSVPEPASVGVAITTLMLAGIPLWRRRSAGTATR